MVYELPRVVLAEFQNGPAERDAAEQLVRLYDAWDGRLIVLLIAGTTEEQPIPDGYIIAAHEVELERPVLWHRGERPPED
jgi:hypothetical protein